MAKVYLDKLNETVAEFPSDIASLVQLEAKHFFSGAALYADGRICMTLTPAGFAMKLPEQLRDELMNEAGAKYLRYFPNAPVKEDYVVLPQRLLDDKATLYSWVRECITYVTSLPQPKQ